MSENTVLGLMEMMGRSHLVVNVGVLCAGMSWLNVLRDQAGAAVADGWVTGVAAGLMRIARQDAPAWLGEYPVSSVAERIWMWLFPLSARGGAHDGGQGALGLAGVLSSAGSVVYLVLGALLFALGSVLPDADSKSSLIGRRLPFSVPGPHRGFLHTDWVLIALLVVAVWQPTRLVFFLWLGAVLHCELDGLSAAGRARFYPLTKYRVYPLSGGEICVGSSGRHVVLYGSGRTSEWVLAGTLLAVCAVAASVAIRL